jgi:hypothetical protein
MAMIAEVVALSTRPRPPQNIALQRSAPASFEANNNILQALNPNSLQSGIPSRIR